MRQGSNPQKTQPLLKLKTNHRVVMVVFVPELSAYYKSMFDVIKVSIASLVKTLPKTSAITIVDNGSCDEVVTYLSDLYKNKKIDALQLFKTNIGKIDALMSGARGAREPIITLTDCDILFKANWVKKTIEIFNTFKNVGSVSPIPTRTGITYFTFSAQKAILLGKLKLHFEEIPSNFEENNKFLKSINWDIETNKRALWPVVSKNKVKAMIGSDHQVLTLRRDILFNCTPSKPSFTKVGKESEREYVDLAIDLSGGLRLSTYNFYAYHMGNVLEQWMVESCEKLNELPKKLDLNLNPELNYKEKNKVKYKLEKKILKKVFNTIYLRNKR